MTDKTPKEQLTEFGHDIAKELKTAEAQKQKIADQQSDQKKLQTAVEQITSLLNAYEPPKTGGAKATGAYTELRKRREAVQQFYDFRANLIAKFSHKAKVEAVEEKVDKEIQEKAEKVKELEKEADKAAKQYTDAKEELDKENQTFNDLTSRPSDRDTELKTLEILTNQIAQTGPELTEVSYYLLEELKTRLDSPKSEITDPKKLKEELDKAFTNMRVAMSSYLEKRNTSQNAQAELTTQKSKLQDLKANRSQHILKLLYARQEQAAAQAPAVAVAAPVK